MESLGPALKGVRKIDWLARKFEDSNEHLLAAWTLAYVVESFLDLADNSEIHEVTIFALESALGYELQVAENILSLPDVDLESGFEEKGEFLEPSVKSLAKELGIHLSSLPLERVLHNRRGAPALDENHIELDLDRNGNLLSFLPERRGKLLVQQGFKRKDGGVTFKLVIAERRSALNRWHHLVSDLSLTSQQGAIQRFRISSVFLIGRDASGQLFLNRLPPTYEFEPIDACEEWIFDMREGDELIKKS